MDLGGGAVVTLRCRENLWNIIYILIEFINMHSMKLKPIKIHARAGLVIDYGMKFPQKYIYFHSQILKVRDINYL